MGWESELHKAKLGHRPRLKGNWERDGFYESFPELVERFDKEKNYQTYYIDEETEHKWEHVSIPSVLDAENLSIAQFHEDYETKCIPSIIQNIPSGYDNKEFVGEWPAKKRWQITALENDTTMVEGRFKCGEDDYEKNIKVKLRHFLSYAKENRDDSPLYIFDSSFDDNKKHADRLLRDYRVPSYFADDLFRLVSENRRPPYRWWLMGPKRSGTCVHYDPLGTSAWNTLIVGKKRWVLFPPYISKSIVKGSGLVRKDEDDEAVHYFSFILPRIKRKASMMKGFPKYKNFCCFEFTQHAGETIYVPQGWWHAVLNITDTVAITQNYCSPRTFDNSWLKTRSGRKRMAWKLLCALDERYPQLATRARTLNKRDNFVMKYDPVEIEKQKMKVKKSDPKRHKK